MQTDQNSVTSNRFVVWYSLLQTCAPMCNFASLSATTYFDTKIDLKVDSVSTSSPIHKKQLMHLRLCLCHWSSLLQHVQFVNARKSEWHMFDCGLRNEPAGWLPTCRCHLSQLQEWKNGRPCHESIPQQATTRSAYHDAREKKRGAAELRFAIG